MLAIRPARSADGHGIAAIYAHAVRHGSATFEIDPPTEAEMASRVAAIISAGYPFLTADLEGSVAGYAYAGPYRLRPGYRWTVEDSVYVAPTAVRRGVGRALLARLIEECNRRGFRQMIAVIGDSANTASIELHRQAGFRPIGTLEAVGHKFGGWLDSVLMQRTLGDGATTPPCAPT